MMLQKALIAFSVVSMWFGSIVVGGGEEPKAIPPDQFDSLYKMIKPRAGESLFWNVPWLTSMREARRKAAAEGKPIIVWSGSGGAPVGVC